MSTLIFMNIEGRGHSVTLVQGHTDSTFSNFFSIETTRPIEVKFHVEPQWDGERKFVQTVEITLPRWPPYPHIIIKHKKKYYSLESKGRLP